MSRPSLGRRSALAFLSASVVTRWPLILVCLLLLAGGMDDRAAVRRTTSNTAGLGPRASGVEDATRARLRESYGRLPMSFEPNVGQADEQVRFLARGDGYRVFLTATEAVFALSKPTTQPIRNAAVTRRTNDRTRPAESSTAVMRMKLVGAMSSQQIRGLDALPGKSNYIRGSDARRWRTNVPTFATVEYTAVYPGIDLRYHGTQQELEYDFVVGPGADPEVIRLDFKGVDEVRVEPNGDLVTRLGEHQIRHRKPVVYQDVDGSRHEIAGGYVQRGRHIGFVVAPHDSTRPLIVDPVIEYSTPLGGGAQDSGQGIAVDDVGAMYVLGNTLSPEFLGVPRPPCGSFDEDAFVVKIDASGSFVVYTTFLGGCDTDQGSAIALDRWSNAYVVGVTDSRDFPTVGGVQPFYGTGRDGILVKLDSAGAVVYSTFLGGFGSEGADGVAVDAEGNAVVSGYTGSPNFPTLNAVQQRKMGQTDGFVLKVNAAGSALVYSTYLGGRDYDWAGPIAIDATGTAYVIGQTLSMDFPTVAARQPAFGGQSDAFVAAFNPSGSLLFSTYLGGSGAEFGAGIAVAGEGHLFVVGSTGSLDFPTKDALQPAHGGGQDVFVAKLSALDGSLVYSTFLGGSDTDAATGIAVDVAGNTYISGDTSSANFPTARPIQAALRGEHDIFVAKLDGSGSQLLYSTYLGGNGNIESASAIAIDGAGNAYVTGFVYEWLGFPLVHPLQAPVWNDGFVAKISDRPCPEDVTGSVDFVAFPFWRIPFTPFRFQWAIIHNKTAVPIAGPLALVMDDLRNAVFIGSRSTTNCFSPEGNPFMVVPVGSDNVLSPNESTLTGLWFFKTQFGRITYTPRVLSGIPTQ